MTLFLVICLRKYDKNQDFDVDEGNPLKENHLNGDQVIKS